MNGTTGFLGRKAELALLETSWRDAGSALIPVYGRRRIGKSELILRFLEKVPGVYHVGKVAPAGLQIREFLQEAARVLGEPLLATQPVDGWRRALELVEERTRPGKKLALAFDEFQWTVGASPELLSVLQELWDRRWRRSGRVMVILCGSYVGFMEREVLGKKSPLFGRRTAQIHLQPFGYLEAADFHPGWSLAQRAAARFVLGGVPQYLRSFDPSRSFAANVQAQLLTEFGPLFNEPEFLLREELRDVSSYHAVLGAVAAGHSTPRAIATASGLAERSLHYNLEQLVQLGYVARRRPLTGQATPPRHVRFALEDPLLRFWFRFVFPHKSFVRQHGPARTWRELIEPELDSYFGGCFERLCREALPRLLQQEGVAADLEAGEYWDRDVQIDVVGVRDDGWIELGECKWGGVPSVPGLVAELEAKVLAFPNPCNATLSRRYFVHKRPGRKPLPGRWHTLEDLYAVRPRTGQ